MIINKKKNAFNTLNTVPETLVGSEAASTSQDPTSTARPFNVTENVNKGKNSVVFSTLNCLRMQCTCNIF